MTLHYWINIIDDKNRFCGYKVTTDKIGQAESHTLSYLTTRELYQQMGDVMGLEKDIERNDE